MKRTHGIAVTVAVVVTAGVFCIAGSLFSGLRPNAMSLEGRASRHVLFSDNVLVDTAGDHKKLEESLVKDNLEDE